MGTGCPSNENSSGPPHQRKRILQLCRHEPIIRGRFSETHATGLSNPVHELLRVWKMPRQVHTQSHHDHNADPGSVNHLTMAAMPTKENMPYPSLTPITAITFHSFTRLNRELYSNSKSVSSNRGNGALGHAYIVLGQDPTPPALVSPSLHPAIQANFPTWKTAPLCKSEP